MFPLTVIMLVSQAPVVPPPAPPATRPMATDGAVRPPWIDNLPGAAGRLYALGTCDLGGREGQAISRASDRARLEVVARMRANVRGRTSMATQTTQYQTEGGAASGYGERQVREDVSVSAQAEDLPGLVVESTYVDAPGRTAYALAYLDLTQARNAMGSRLARLQETRAKVGDEQSRKARWRLRKVKDDLDRLEEALGLLSLTGTGQEFQPKLDAERNAVEARLKRLEEAALPPLDLSKITVSLRSNVDLPAGIEAYLANQISACGLHYRSLNPDLVLDLTFSGTSGGPEFIFTDLDVYRGLSYCLDAQLKLTAEDGGTLGRPMPIQIIQSGSPEGMVQEFRRQFERRLPRLIAVFQSEWQ